MSLAARLLLGSTLGLGACHSEGPAAPDRMNSQVELPAESPPLDTIRLTPDAHASLGIETSQVSISTARRTRVVGGFVIDPSSGSLSLSAPLAGIVHAGDVALEPGATVEADTVLLRLVPLAPVDRDLRAQARRQREATSARVELTRARVERIRELIGSKASSQRALEEAIAEQEVAESDDRAARARERALLRAPLDADVSLDLIAPRSGLIRSIFAVPGQVVGSGAALLELVDQALWLRVPVYAGDLDAVAEQLPVRVARLGHEFGELTAAPVLAPPTGDPLANTVDLIYALDSSALRTPGERVLVELPLTSDAPVASVPASALIVAADGSTWVYECLPEHSFRRRRVEVLRRVGDDAQLGRGPAEGTCIVSVGALELYGAEFGVSH